MKKVEVLKLMDLVEDIRKLDELIELSRKNKTSAFVLNQYEAKKIKMVGSIINELANPPIQSMESYFLIKKILNKYYPNIAEDEQMNNSDIGKIVAVIEG
ncbi:MAG: hypothetical protein JWR38_3792 [Mucilaginibacter sp.]|nr:hypothetical protein [Mucilaginibacter sp.]